MLAAWGKLRNVLVYLGEIKHSILSLFKYFRKNNSIFLLLDMVCQTWQFHHAHMDVKAENKAEKLLAWCLLHMTSWFSTECLASPTKSYDHIADWDWKLLTLPSILGKYSHCILLAWENTKSINKHCLCVVLSSAIYQLCGSASSESSSIKWD